MGLEGRTFNILFYVVVEYGHAATYLLGCEGYAVMSPLLLVLALIEIIAGIKELAFPESDVADVFCGLGHLLESRIVFHYALVVDAVDEFVGLLRGEIDSRQGDEVVLLELLLSKQRF
ncbi:hypothetical protein ES703_45998 [subsurface metagenome]